MIQTARRFPTFLFCQLMVLDVMVLLVEKIASNRVDGEGWSLVEGFVSQPWLWLVLGLKVGQLVTWTAILARADISLAFPLSSLSYPLAMLASTLVLGEVLGWQVWAGGILITAGAAVMGPGGHGAKSSDKTAPLTSIQHSPGAPIVPLWRQPSMYVRIAILAMLIAAGMMVALHGAPPAPAPVAANTPPSALQNVRSYMFQLQGLDAGGAIERLARSDYDLVIIDDVHQAKGGERVDVAKLVATIRAGKPGRLVLAYFDAGAAENDRTYWTSTWKSPRDGGRGKPEFILGAHPPGWEDTYYTAFWSKPWQDVILTGAENALDKSLACGFDGVLVDGIEAVHHPLVAAVAKETNTDPAAAMTDLLAQIRAHIRQKNANGLVLAMNGVSFFAANPKAAQSVDGIIAEGIWFGGRGDVRWSSGDGGDIHNTATGDRSTEVCLKQCRDLAAAGKKIFSLDYCLRPENAERTYRDAAANGFIPLVTRSSLGGMTTTPPPK